MELWQGKRRKRKIYLPLHYQADVVINTAYVFEVGVLKSICRTTSLLSRMDSLTTKKQEDL